MNSEIPTFVIGRIAIKDPYAWAEYRDQVPGTLAPFGGDVVLRATGGQLLGGAQPGTPAPHPDVVVLRFADAASARGWFESAAYRALIPLRERAADVVLTFYPG